MSKESIYFTRKQYEYLKRVFPEPLVVPGAQRDALMHTAGAYSVVEFVKSKIGDPMHVRVL